MNHNILITTKDPFPIIKRAVDKAVDLVKPTYGPASNKVIIQKATHALVVDDGVQILRDLELPDPNEHAVMKVVREAAIRTNDRAGDGTTGASIMLQSIIGAVDKLRKRDGHKIERELKAGLTDAVAQLREQAKPVESLEELRKVARVSFDNPEVSDLIAGTWHDVGVDGVVTVESGSTMSTKAELSEGISINRGYISPIMVTNPERMEAQLEKPYILVTDMRLTEGNDLLPLMNKIAEHSKGAGKLLIIAENVEQGALATLIINQPHVINPHTQRPGVLQSVAITAPQEDRQTLLEDIALMTGARMFSVAKGDKLEEAKIEDLGTADRVIVRQKESVIVGPKANKEVMIKAIADLSAARNMAETDAEKKVLEKRLAFYANKVAVIRVGAPTENEQKSLRYKVEDAVNAVRSALRGGVVAGSGLALARLTTSSAILNDALKAPHRQLLDNMGLEEIELKDGEALNVITGETGPFMKVGVLDPVEVLIAGVESAVSIASLLVTTSGMIIEKPQHMQRG